MFDGPIVIVGYADSPESSFPYRLNAGGIFFDQGWDSNPLPIIGSLSLLIIMLLVDMLILKCSLEEEYYMKIIVPMNGGVTTEAAVF